MEDLFNCMTELIFVHEGTDPCNNQSIIYNTGVSTLIVLFSSKAPEKNPLKIFDCFSFW